MFDAYLYTILYTYISTTTLNPLKEDNRNTIIVASTVYCLTMFTLLNVPKLGSKINILLYFLILYVLFIIIKYVESPIYNICLNIWWKPRQSCQ